ncbi:MAG: N-acetyltransferase [Henriciella sp.]|nr:N-acetyltransferase [Henriciella sp.]
MSDIWIRQAREEDADAVAALNTAAFGGAEEAQIVRQLADDGDSLYSLVAHNDQEILGHIQFFKIAIDGQDIAAGLGPMSVTPDRQKQGIGGGLIRFGLRLIEGSGRPLVFVLGHPDYYPKFGFDAASAAPFTAPWSGPAFMALRFGEDGPSAGDLAYPRAFEE